MRIYRVKKKKKKKAIKGYKKYLTSSKWKEKVKQIKEVYKNECCNCGSKHILDVHHLTYARIFNENLSDLRLLCRACHSSWHSDKLSIQEKEKILAAGPFPEPKKKKKKAIKIENPYIIDGQRAKDLARVLARRL